MDWLAAHWVDVIAVVGTVGTIAFGILSCWFFKWSKQEKRPSYHMRTFPMWTIGQAMPEITIHYAGHGEPLTTFSATVLLFWNDGSLAIRKGDVSKETPLAITAKGDCKIVGVRPLKENNSNNRFHLQLNKDKTKVSVEFDYLNSQDGIALVVLHTGTDNTSVELTGGGIDSKPLKKVMGGSEREVVIRRRWQIPAVLFVVAVVVICTAMDFFLPPIQWPRTCLALGFLASSVGIWVKNRYFGRRKIHKDFDLYW